MTVSKIFHSDTLSHICHQGTAYAHMSINIWSWQTQVDLLENQKEKKILSLSLENVQLNEGNI